MVKKLEPGSELLVTDLEVLLQEAKDGEFGDFTNEKYATPKIALYNRLIELADNVKGGKYD